MSFEVGRFGVNLFAVGISARKDLVLFFDGRCRLGRRAALGRSVARLHLVIEITWLDE